MPAAPLQWSKPNQLGLWQKGQKIIAVLLEWDNRYNDRILAALTLTAWSAGGEEEVGGAGRPPSGLLSLSPGLLGTDLDIPRTHWLPSLATIETKVSQVEVEEIMLTSFIWHALGYHAN